jgi:hypothetical protein
MQAQPRRKPGPPRVPLEDRYTVRDGGYETPCWHDRRPVEASGYGRQLTLPDGRQVKAHRAYYEYFVGPVPEGLELDHLCENRWCVNPGHLEPVTHTENIRRSAVTKLNREIVLELHRLRAQGLSYREIASCTGIHWRTLASALLGETWRDVYDEVHAAKATDP